MVDRAIVVGWGVWERWLTGWGYALLVESTLVLRRKRSSAASSLRALRVGIWVLSFPRA